MPADGDELSPTEKQLGEWRWVDLDTVDSTQDVAHAEWDRDCSRPLAVSARRQRTGRGRRGNDWASPLGGLWASLARKCNGPPDPFEGLLTALAVLDAVESLLPPNSSGLGLKWPNDLIARHGKWGGILSEVRRDARGDSVVITGLGLNLALDAETLPVPTATSIQAEFGESPSPVDVLSRILPRFDALVALDREAAPGRAGRTKTRGLVADRLETLGCPVSWQDPQSDDRGRGIATSLEADGALTVRCDDGTVTSLRSGEVHHLRRANRG